MMKATLFGFLLMLLPRFSLACAVCFGAPESPVVKATEGAVLLLLGVLFVVLGCFAAFVIYLARRARMPLQPHEELAHYFEMQRTNRN